MNLPSRYLETNNVQRSQRMPMKVLIVYEPTFFLFLTRFTHLDFSIVLYGFQSHIIFAKYNEFSVQNLLAVRFRYKIMFPLAPK